MPDAASTERLINGAEAIREGMDQCMAADDRVFLMGEGAADPKGIFGTTAGLVQKYGTDRVIEMPVAENGLTGIAIGAALMGRRPVMVHQRVDFALLALEQIFNNAAKTHYVTGGKHRVPLVIRMIIGRGWGQGPEHSQSLESVFAHFPGLKVVLPSTAQDAKGMLVAAIRDDNPVVMLEHRWTHYAIGNVPEALYETPLTGPAHVREGSDVTIVATSYMTYEAREAADAMARAGVTADVFDMRVLRPLDITPVVEAVQRTGRLIVGDVGWKLFGAGAEIITSVVEQAFHDMKAPPVRLGLPDHPTPSTRSLVPDFYPYSGDIVARTADITGAHDRLAPVMAALAEARAQRPIDVPNPDFKGPF
jgi:pyruvate dehydrogenase E1 component beta subunit